MMTASRSANCTEMNSGRSFALETTMGLVTAPLPPEESADISTKSANLALSEKTLAAIGRPGP